MKNNFMVKALKLTAHCSQLIAACSRLTTSSIPNSRFVIPDLSSLILDSRFLICIFISFIAIHFSSTIAAVNYDTAWTFLYDGGKQTIGMAIADNFYDVKSLKNGSCACVGLSGESSNSGQSLMIKLDINGKYEVRPLCWRLS
jgi:hypothetical protein